MGDPTTLLLCRDDLATLVRLVGVDRLMDELIARLTAALEDHDRDSDCVPPRRGFAETGAIPSVLEWMPARAASGRVTIKVVGYNPGNPQSYGLPTIVSTLSRYEQQTGHLVALADGTLLTAMRTGAASAVASRRLASERSRTLGIIGCGAQSVTQVHALSRVFPLQRINYFDTDPRAMQTFPTRIARFGIAALPASAARVLRDADILCTCTSVAPGAGPVFEDGEHAAHLHINAVGSDLPGKTEVPRTLLDRALVVPDFLEQALVEGECQQLPHDRLGPSLPDICKPSWDPHHARTVLTVFDSTGFALEDHVAMDVLIDHAAALGLGTPTVVEVLPSDPRNPYGLAPDRTREDAPRFDVDVAMRTATI